MSPIGKKNIYTVRYKNQCIALVLFQISIKLGSYPQYIFLTYYMPCFTPFHWCLSKILTFHQVDLFICIFLVINMEYWHFLSQKLNFGDLWTITDHNCEPEYQISLCKSHYSTLSYKSLRFYVFVRWLVLWFLKPTFSEKMSILYIFCK